MLTNEQWRNKLDELVKDTEFESFISEEKVNHKVSCGIVKKGKKTPRYIKIYVLQKYTNIVLNKAVFFKVKEMFDIGEETKIKNGEYFFNQVSDDFIDKICRYYVINEI